MFHKVWELERFSNSKSDLPCHSRALTMVPFNRLAFDIFYLHTKFGNSCFSRSEDMIVGIKTENGSCDPDHAPLQGWFVIHRVGFDTFYMCAKFDDSS